MYDDGTHGDAINGDGIYTAQWDTTGQTTGTYYVDFEAKDNSIYQNLQSIDNGAIFILI